MHTALWQLLWLDFRGSWRGLLNIRRSWRQVVLMLLMLLFVGMLVAVRALNTDGTPPDRFGATMPFWALIYLLATWLTASADRGLVMRPAEIHFIVGGPFRARDVITLNLIRLCFRSFISATVLSLLAAAYVSSYLSALTGMWMLIGLSLLGGMTASLAARRAQNRWIKRLRRLFNLLAIGALLMLVAQSMEAIKQSGEKPQIRTVAASALSTPVGQVILPPLAWMFSPLSNTDFFTQTMVQLPSRLAIIACLVGLVYLLGGQYLEASTRRTDLSIARRQNALRSGVSGDPGSRSWTTRVTLPMFGRLGGIGSVAWTQMLHSIRILPRFLIFTFTVVGVVLVVPVMVDPARLMGWGAIAWMSGLTLYADFLLLLQLPVGFLGPVAQREMLKSLPIPSWRLVFGQLAGPVIPLGVIHVCVTLLFLFLVSRDWRTVLLTSLALLPAVCVLIANINLLGAWNIIRPRALQQRDVLAAGRAMASVWIFFLMLTPAIFFGTATAMLAARCFGASDLIYLFGASLGVLLSNGIYVWLLARNFRNWQPSSAEGGKEETEYDR